MAAIFRIPFVKFLGISPGGLNATGESDLRNYYDHVSAKQEKIFRKPINRLIDLMQGHLFGAIDPDIRAEFIPINDEDDAKRAATLKTKADRDAIYLDRGVLSPEEVREGLAADYDSGYSSIEPEDVPEAPAAKFGSGEGLDDMDKAGMVGDSSLASMEFEGLNAAMDSLVWIPKSRSSAHEGKIVSAEGWLAKKAGLKTNEGTAKKEAAFNAGKERYESLLEKAKAGGVKGVRVGMRASTIREKMAAAGVSE